MFFACSEQRLERPSFAVRLANAFASETLVRWPLSKVSVITAVSTVVCLAETGRNFAAGGGKFSARCNMGLVDKDTTILDADEEKQEVYNYYIKEHVAHTGSAVGQEMLDNWGICVSQFFKVFPQDYKHCWPVCPDHLLGANLRLLLLELVVIQRSETAYRCKDVSLKGLLLKWKQRSFNSNCKLLVSEIYDST
jgi:hypothetical protein